MMIKGAYGVLLCPFTMDGKVNYSAYEKELDFVAKSDITGVFACGTTGEFISLSPRENIEMLTFTANFLKGKKKLLAGASNSNPYTTIEYMKAAYNLGYDACMICPPYYFTMKQDDVVRYYKHLCRQDIMDIVLYKIPMFTNGIELSAFQELITERRIIGMKDSSQNIKQIMHEADIVERKRPDFSLLCGTDDSLVPSLVAGCVGSVTAFSIIVPEVNAKIYELYNRGRVTEALELNRRALRLLRFADSIMFPSGYKLIFEARGFSMGQCQVVDEPSMAGIWHDMKNELDTLLGSVKKY